MSALKNEVGIVIIGRNEGQRLIDCITSAQKQSDKIVYVDSASSDDSVANARARDVIVIELDMSIPFSAARARNEGWKKLIAKYEGLKYIHFIDGDCAFVDGWIEKAYDFLRANQTYSVACGRRCEKFPRASIYNQLCDIEWNTPVGDSLACGGDALIATEALRQVNGYTNSFIAGEEPEMCYRMRLLGWKIRRLDSDMTLHDANIMYFRQWWKRAKRCGYAYALGNDAHGQSNEQYKRKPTQSALLWGLFIPLVLCLLTVFISIFFVFLFGIYLVQVVRMYRISKLDKQVRLAWATSIVIAKLPECVGVLEFYYKKLFKKQSTIIEYK